MLSLFLGTAEYMSPEQSAGNPSDFRSDIYSLGCIMYQAITGRPPFTGETAMETMYEHLRASVPLITEVTAARNYTKELVDTVMEALHKDPDKRPQTAAQFKDKIQYAMSSKNTLKKKREIAAPLIVAVCLLVFVPVGAMWVSSNLKSYRKSRLQWAAPNKASSSSLIDKSGIALISKALWAEGNGDYKVAERCLIAGLQKLPDSMLDEKRDGYVRLGIVYGSLHKPKDALRAYQNSLVYTEPNAYGSRVGTYMLEVDILESMGMKERAAKLANDCLRLADSDKIDSLHKMQVYKQRAAIEQAEKHYAAGLKYARKALEVMDEHLSRTFDDAIESSWIIFDDLKRTGQADQVAARDLKKTFAAFKESTASDISDLFCNFADYSMDRGYAQLARRCISLAKEKSPYANRLFAKRLQQKIEDRVQRLNNATSEKDLPEIK